MSGLASRPQVLVKVAVRDGVARAEEVASETAPRVIGGAPAATRRPEVAAKPAAVAKLTNGAAAPHADTQAEVGAAVKNDIVEVLTSQGYNPPQPPPLLAIRETDRILVALGAPPTDAALATATKDYQSQLLADSPATVSFIAALVQHMGKPDAVSRVKRFLGRVDPAIDKATLSLELPIVSKALEAKMRSFEHFITESWCAEPCRAIVAVHVDAETRSTIVQIGTAEHGPVYITIPKLLSDGDVAHRSLTELVSRLSAFTEAGDPMAVIDGAYQQLNFTQMLRPKHVLRVPSGDLPRLSANLAVARARPRLSPHNTVVLNSAPHDLNEYRRVFPDDPRAVGWAAWQNEAADWDAAAAPGFAPTPEVSRDGFIRSLSTAENVIVIVAHCDGEAIFMSQPPPVGTTISGDDLRAHKAEIMANQPFVYLFSCNAGDLRRMENFAGILLECGAAGVLASQTTLGGNDERGMLSRLLSDGRGAPPIEDI